MPLVEGDCSCPDCGDRLWTVRAEPQQTSPGVLVPVAHLPILRGRPTLRPQSKCFVRLCVLLLRPLVILWMIPRQRVLENRVNDKLNQIGDHPNRVVLDRVLGEPCYAVSGEVCDVPDRPDLIECYESEGCCIDLWFKNDRLIDITGFVKPSDWDLVLSGVK